MCFTQSPSVCPSVQCMCCVLNMPALKHWQFRLRTTERMMYHRLASVPSIHHQLRPEQMSWHNCHMPSVAVMVYAVALCRCAV